MTSWGGSQSTVRPDRCQRAREPARHWRTSWRGRADAAAAGNPGCRVRLDDLRAVRSDAAGRDGCRGNQGRASDRRRVPEVGAVLARRQCVLLQPQPRQEIRGARPAPAGRSGGRHAVVRERRRGDGELPAGRRQPPGTGLREAAYPEPTADHRRGARLRRRRPARGRPRLRPDHPGDVVDGGRAGRQRLTPVRAHVLAGQGRRAGRRAGGARCPLSARADGRGQRDRAVDAGLRGELPLARGDDASHLRRRAGRRGTGRAPAARRPLHPRLGRALARVRVDHRCAVGRAVLGRGRPRASDPLPDRNRTAAQSQRGDRGPESGLHRFASRPGARAAAGGRRPVRAGEHRVRRPGRPPGRPQRHRAHRGHARPRPGAPAEADCLGRDG